MVLAQEAGGVTLLFFDRVPSWRTGERPDPADLPFIMKLALGSAQFGLPYGIANRNGQVDPETVGRIIDAAKRRGVDMIDTAIAYGASEEHLGACGISDFRVITKLPAIPEGTSDLSGWMISHIEGSLDRLRIPHLHGVLLHRSTDSYWHGNGLVVETLERMKAEGLTQKIGVSIYSPNELEPPFPLDFVDIVQAPVNVLDRRLLDSGWLDDLHAMGIEIHARSIFMQGLLLMQRSEVPEKFERWSQVWNAWCRYLDDNRISPLQACLHWVGAMPQVARIVVGVDNLQQFMQIIEAYENPVPTKISTPLECTDEALLNPSKWTML